jgi:serine/threonine protein phosphatase 1
MSRLLAIGDIHGCLTAFDTLWSFVKPAANDMVVLLGDYIDRGPDSYGVLERVIRLHTSGQMVCLRGNHELMMLGARESRENMRFWLQVGGRDAIESYPEGDGLLERVPDHHWRFIENTCVDFYETSKHIFVHANLHFKTPFDQHSTSFLHWEFLDRDNHQPHFSGKTMVCGHSEQRNGDPIKLPGAIGIDTWAYGDGWLTCLDVYANQYYQANEAGETREYHL